MVGLGKLPCNASTFIFAYFPEEFNVGNTVNPHELLTYP